jgi:protein-tyrosine phosphatase
MSYKLLFVCLGNICRSPSAENIMRHLVEEAGLSDKILCDSAGTSAYHIGSAPDRRMSAAAKEKEIELVGRARKFQPIDFERFDLILAMDRENYQELIYSDSEGKYRDKIKMMCSFATNHSDQEVPDPYYGGEAGFQYVIELLFDACRGLLDYIVKSELQKVNN